MSKTSLLLVSCLSFSAGCESEGTTVGGAPDGAAVVEGTALRFTASSLPELGTDYVYEGWIIVDGEALTAGRFTVDGDGKSTPAQFALDPADAEAATLYVLTIEPKDGDDPAPSSTHILAGEISEGMASLSVDHPGAFDTDFASAKGSYILATPTTGDDTLQERGIWWINPGDGSASLDLPTLPAGWAYEGWVVGSDGPVSTGRFTDPGGADSDLAGSAKGDTGDGPALPGQDFIDPSMILNDGSTVAVISVEPEPDDSPAPFLIKPLVHDPIGAEVAPAMHLMTNNAAATLPAATLVIE